MRKSLHQQTAKLPQVDAISDEEFRAGLPATSTQAAIYWGTHWAAVGGVERLLAEVSAACGFPPDTQVFLTGGNGEALDNGLRGRIPQLIHDPLLTLEGIRIAAEAVP
jgi:pantothenate kinase type III